MFLIFNFSFNIDIYNFILIMKLQKLISELQNVQPFANPKEDFEQYSTSAETAGNMFHSISQYHNLEDYTIADLGCGTGILGIAAALCGCENVFLFDIDEEALDIAKQNIQDLNLENNIQLIQVDVNTLVDWNTLNKYFDMVITNPPFGIRSKKGADTEFLKIASKICHGTIFSLHKLSTINYLKKFYTKKGVKEINCFEMKYDLPKSYKFHKKDKKDIEVVCLEAKIEDIIIE